MIDVVMFMSKEKTTVNEWLSEWLQLRSAQLRPRTIEQYRRLITLHTVDIGHRKLRKLKPEHIQRLLIGIAEQGKTRTAEQVYVLLNTALRAAVQLGRIERSPMEAVMRPAHRKTLHTVWSPEEQRAVMQALRGDPYQVEILLGLLCGLRRGEICGLMWQDVDFRAGMLHIRRQRQRQSDGALHTVEPKSAAGRRDIPIPKALRAPLAARMAIGGYVAAVTPEALSRVLQRVERRAGVQHIGLHGLRHTMATNAVRAGASLRVVQQLVGHSSFALTASVYTHPDEEMLRRAVDDAARFVI